MTNSNNQLKIYNTAIVSSQDAGFYKYLQEINSIPCLTVEEEFMLAKAYLEQHNLEAAQKLVTSHLKLVAKIALKYKNYGLPIAELISEGNLGLLQAVKKFDPNLGFRLSTYAMWWIKASIQEYILHSWSLVKIGTTAAQKKLFFSLNKIKRKLSNIYSRNITADDFPQIASELGVAVNDVAHMNLRMSGADISLNVATNGDENSSELIEFIPESRASQETRMITNQEAKKKHSLLQEAIRKLNDREMQIFIARKLKDVPSTLDELSNKFSISKERVRQIENKAFTKIQDFMLKHINPDHTPVALLSKGRV